MKCRILIALAFMISAHQPVWAEFSPSVDELKDDFVTRSSVSSQKTPRYLRGLSSAGSSSNSNSNSNSPSLQDTPQFVKLALAGLTGLAALHGLYRIESIVNPNFYSTPCHSAIHFFIAFVAGGAAGYQYEAYGFICTAMLGLSARCLAQTLHSCHDRLHDTSHTLFDRVSNSLTLRRLESLLTSVERFIGTQLSAVVSGARAAAAAGFAAAHVVGNVVGGAERFLGTAAHEVVDAEQFVQHAASTAIQRTELSLGNAARYVLGGLVSEATSLFRRAPNNNYGAMDLEDPAVEIYF